MSVKISVRWRTTLSAIPRSRMLVHSYASGPPFMILDQENAGSLLGMPSKIQYPNVATQIMTSARIPALRSSSDLDNFVTSQKLLSDRTTQPVNFDVKWNWRQS